MGPGLLLGEPDHFHTDFLEVQAGDLFQKRRNIPEAAEDPDNFQWSVHRIVDHQVGLNAPKANRLGSQIPPEIIQRGSWGKPSEPLPGLQFTSQLAIRQK
jgi:hypothetical protein